MATRHRIGDAEDLRARAPWGELGFVVPPFPFIAHTRGWDAEDMERSGRKAQRLAAGPEEPR